MRPFYKQQLVINKLPIAVYYDVPQKIMAGAYRPRSNANH